MHANLKIPVQDTGTSAYPSPYDILVSRLEGARGHRPHAKGPRSCMVKCPVAGHNDRNASLSVREFSDGGVSVKCFAGCDKEAILSALGLSPSDLFPRDYRDDYQYGRKYRGLAPFPLREAIIKNRHLLLTVQMGYAKLANEIKMTEEELNTFAKAALFVYEILGEVK